MRELLDACGSSSEYYLALSATTKASDIREICQEFEPFKYQAIILTKLDETLRVGNIISILAEQRKPLAFITDGQGVPLDIHRATRGRLLRNLEGFKINRQRLDEIYPERED
jgi:flagellar biosynthesis protein FlhF